MSFPEDDDKRDIIAEQWWIGIVIWIAVVAIYFIYATCTQQP
jgi:hypothetical protein